MTEWRGSDGGDILVAPELATEPAHLFLFLRALFEADLVRFVPSFHVCPWHCARHARLNICQRLLPQPTNTVGIEGLGACFSCIENIGVEKPRWMQGGARHEQASLAHGRRNLELHNQASCQISDPCTIGSCVAACRIAIGIEHYAHAKFWREVILSPESCRIAEN